jgi:SAM-dependent methyltransferase
MNAEISQGVLDVLGPEPGTGRKLLDASCAEGNSTEAYLKLGYEVTPSNYDPAEFRLPGLTCVRADLNQAWPFPDASFDVVVLQEVIEHLENMPFVFREARRLLKPGGCFIFSTPNMLNWTSRLRFLGTGFYQGRKKPLRVITPPGDAPNWNIVPFHVYHWICHHYQLRIERVLGTRKRAHSFLLGLLLYPLAALYTYVWWVARERNPAQRAYNHDLWRHLYSRQLLFSNGIVVRVRKT